MAINVTFIWENLFFIYIIHNRFYKFHRLFILCNSFFIFGFKSVSILHFIKPENNFMNYYVVKFFFYSPPVTALPVIGSLYLYFISRLAHTQKTPYYNFIQLQRFNTLAGVFVEKKLDSVVTKRQNGNIKVRKIGFRVTA